MTRVLCLAVLVCVGQCLPMSQDELEDFSNYLLKTSSLDIHVKSAEPDADEEDLVSDHAWEESGKFEGDLILNDRQRRLIVENVEGLSRNGLTDSTKRWPNNEVIYFIQKEHFTSGQVQAIQDGINDLAQASCVKFRPYRKGDRDAVVIQGSRRGCFSQVGYQGGYQVLNLSGRHPVGRGCFRHGTVVHELLHSLGFYHMQSSPDRDDYINVVWANIVQPARHNFRKYNSFSVSDFGVGYDYDSVLHYSRRAFSANGQDTLVPKKSGAQIGQRVGLSDKDTQKLNKMYCDADNDSALQAEEDTNKKPKNKKKKPKNQPFEGHGIGYHQGKTVVIKLPAAETYKLANVPSTHMFDFSKTPQVVPPEAEGYRFGEEIIYSYNPAFLPTVDITRDYNIPILKPIVKKNTEQQGTKNQIEPINQDKDVPFLNHNTQQDDTKDELPLQENIDKISSLQHSNEVKPEYVPIDYYDKDLKEAFDRLTKIVKQHIYPNNNGYDHKINKDYSKFFTPKEHRQSYPLDDSLDDKRKTISYGSSTITPLKQIDKTLSDDKIRINQIQDRMDVSFRTSLPTKKPYSSYEQTETPNYATLEYLKNRDDYSSLYSPKSNADEERNESVSANDEKYKNDIKINPYDREFYTDYVTNNTKSRLTDASAEENASEEIEPSRLEEQSSKSVYRDGIDSSYRPLISTKKPYSAYEQTETPSYATLEYLRDRHDISSHYPPKKSDENRKKPNTVSEVDNPPTESDWYVKDSYGHNPADYDIKAYSDYIQPNTKHEEDDEYDYSHDEKEDYRSNTSTENKTVTKPRDDDQDFYSKYKSEKEKLTTDVNFNGSKKPSEPEDTKHTEAQDYDYYGKYQNEEYDSNPIEDAETIKEPHESHKSLEYKEDYSNDYERELAKSAREPNKDKNDEESPKKNQAYTSYGVAVPLTKDWFKISYVPEVSKADGNTNP